MDVIDITIYCYIWNNKYLGELNKLSFTMAFKKNHNTGHPVYYTVSDMIFIHAVTTVILAETFTFIYSDILWEWITCLQTLMINRFILSVDPSPSVSLPERCPWFMPTGVWQSWGRNKWWQVIQHTVIHLDGRWDEGVLPGMSVYVSYSDSKRPV